LVFERPPQDTADDDDDDDDEEEEESEEEEEDVDVTLLLNSLVSPNSLALSDVEMKKNRRRRKNSRGDEEDDGLNDELLVNANHITKKLNISDLDAPREPHPSRTVCTPPTVHLVA